MTAAQPFKYRAFLSYSHRDQDAGAALHKALERHRIPRTLIGKPGRLGPIPAKLRPIFRDRYDLEAGHSLSEQVQQAIRESEALIVICSPAAAKSRYVNGEIIAFKTLGRHDRIFPIIVDGEPGDPERECFPPALRFKVAPDGTVTDEKEEPLAADARSVGDGEELAQLKLVAGMLGVDLDELRRREAEDERRRKRIWAGIAASMAGLAVLSGFQWWRAEVALDQSERLTASLLDRASSLVNQSVATTDEFGVPVRVGISILNEAEKIFADMDKIGTASDKLAKGRVRMLMAFADSLSRLGKIDEQQRRSDEAYVLASNLLAMKGGDPELLHLKAEALLRQGYVQSTRYELANAQAKYAEALAIRTDHLGGDTAEDPVLLIALATIHNAISVAYNRSGESQAALDAARKSYDIAVKLAQIPGQEAAADDKRVPALTVIADMYRQLGKRDKALESADEGLSEVERILSVQPDSVPWLRRKSQLLMVQGDVYRRKNTYEKSLSKYQECFDIRDRLHNADVQNTSLAVEAAYARIKLGEALTNLNRLDQSDAQFHKSMETYDGIVALNPDHRLAARYSIDALDGIGEIHRRKREFPLMIEVAHRKLKIAEHLKAIDPDNRDSIRVLARVKTSLGNAYREAGDVETAMARYREAKTELGTLKHPSQTDEETLAEALEELGEALHDKKRSVEAESAYNEAIVLRHAHAEKPNSKRGAKLSYAYSMQKLADVKLDTGSTREGLDLVEKALAIRQPLFDDTLTDESVRMFAYGYEQAGRAHMVLGEAPAAVAAFEKSVPLRTSLVEKDQGNAQRRKNLGETWRLLAEARLATGDVATACGGFGTAREHVSRALASAPDKSEWAATLDRIDSASSANCPAPAPAPETGSVDKPADPAVTVPATPAAAEGAPSPNP
jgi:tetratricopeptide (TPR) repeat protein